ncbi:lipid-A-disaccharide synthase N-terminal domain-containing protein [Aliiroseovarius sp. M344]|uniref:lipid-A-disaccharide synthase N-terminal domain-containing protein n=1 Tax=Aliiroseovarius sp. M344 TaxID=2867010 RepID=UPI0021AD8D15|nr:lipid-A-disaccharide synthase N-terminal domain-containing protein [Aliiroseovarius sp. M344]
MSISSIWLGIGFLGQLLFTSRFLVQWIVSERRGESVVPLAFWWFSLAGGLTLLSYAIWRQDPVFILGQATGLFVYVRNLILIRRRKAEASS